MSKLKQLKSEIEQLNIDLGIKKKQLENLKVNYKRPDPVNVVNKSSRDIKAELDKALYSNEAHKTQLDPVLNENNTIADKLIHYKECLDLLNEVSESRRNTVIKTVEDEVSKAISFIMGEDYKFEIDIVEQQNKTIAKAKIITKDMELYPIEDTCGAGLICVISAIIRIVFRALDPNNQLPLLLDEPLRNLRSVDKLQRVYNYINNLAKELNIQIIIISHDIELELENIVVRI